MADAVQTISNPPAVPEGANGSTAPEWARDYEPEVQSWITKKNSPSPASLAKSYYELERIYGADKSGRAIFKPTDMNDPTQREQYFTALGRPASPDLYQLKTTPETEHIAPWLRQEAYKNGLSADQAQGLHDAWASRIKDTTARVSAETEVAQNLEVEKIKAEWGDKWEQNVGICNRGMRALGLNQDQLDLINAAIGNEATFRTMFAAGQSAREDPGTGTTEVSVSGLPNSPEGAKAEISRLQKDQVFISELNGADPAKVKVAKQRWDALFRVAYPGDAM